AVGTEQAEAFAAADREIETAHDFVITVRLAQAGDGEHDVVAAPPRHAGASLPVARSHRHMPAMTRVSCGSRPWTKWPQPGKTTMGSCCGRAQANTSASATTSSSSPWMTIVSAGTRRGGKCLN